MLINEAIHPETKLTIFISVLDQQAFAFFLSQCSWLPVYVQDKSLNIFLSKVQY